MSNENDFRKVNMVTSFSISIISFLILIPIVSIIRIPLERSNTGIVSLANTTNVSPYTNYVKFLVLLLVPSCVAVATLNIKQELINRYWRILNIIIGKTFSFLGNIRFYTIFILLLIFTWVVNKNYENLGWTLTDAFHEGEYLGFLPNFLTLEKPFLRSFMIHGFGLDALTSLIASNLSEHSNIIALTRFFRMTQGTIGYLGCYWIIWELVCSIKFNLLKQNIFFLSSIVFTILDGVYFKFFTDIFAGRDTLFILQLALTIRFFRIVSINNLHKTEKLLLPIFIGASIPISILYVYDRAAYFLFVYLFACSLSFCFGQKLFRDLFIRSTFGLSSALILLIVVLGLAQVSEIFLQILFWVRYGRYISFNLLVPPNVNTFFAWVRLSFATLTQIFTILYLISDYKRSVGLGTLLKNKFLFIILLFASLVYMRITLDRPNNADYVGSGSLISALLLIYVFLDVFKVNFENKVTKLMPEPLFKRLSILFIILVILIHPVLNPFLSLDKLRKLYTTYKVPDLEIVSPDLLRTSNVLKPEVNHETCFFTLNQEGLWYYLFNKPSCSKFSIIYYARTVDAQETVIHEVDARKPKIILFGSTTRANAFEGIPIADAVPIIYRYFLNHYKPYKVVESRWFWKRSDKKLTFTRNASHIYYGSIDTALGEITFKGDHVSLSGSAIFLGQRKMADAVYVSYGQDNQLIEVTNTDENSKWTIPIPTMSLPSGKNILRVWLYDAKSSQLVQIGEDIKINLIARYGFQGAT